MRTRITIGMIVVTACAAVVTAAALILVNWGLPLFALAVGVALVVFIAYVRVIRPWHARWGATDEEISRAMPGDEIIARAKSTTRAITIAATPSDIWPWLQQIGYGRAGWYSYDWIDNDGHPSAQQIRSDLQHLEVGQQILMVPGMGPVVRDVASEHYLVAGDDVGGTWCLSLEPIDASHTRLVSRWRQSWKITPASVIWIALADPGVFIMEQKMLRGIRARAEATCAHPVRK